jgi:hypothetical protein
VVRPDPADADLFAPDPELDKPLSAEDSETVLQWMANGEGPCPWPASRS